MIDQGFERSHSPTGTVRARRVHRRRRTRRGVSAPDSASATNGIASSSGTRATASAARESPACRPADEQSRVIRSLSRPTRRSSLPGPPAHASEAHVSFGARPRPRGPADARAEGEGWRRDGAVPVVLETPIGRRSLVGGLQSPGNSSRRIRLVCCEGRVRGWAAFAGSERAHLFGDLVSQRARLDLEGLEHQRPLILRSVVAGDQPCAAGG